MNNPPQALDGLKEPILPRHRHNILRGAAVRMAKRGYSYEQIVAELASLNARLAVPPLEDSEILQIADWIRDRSPYSDLGNAQFFAARYGTKMFWMPKEKQWLLFEDGRWTDAGSGGAGLLSHYAIRDLHREADGLPATARDDAAKWAHKSESAGHIEAMVRLTKSLCPAEPDDFDQDHWLLNAGNGAIDLRSGLLCEPRPEDMLRLSTSVSCDPAATCPRWLKFLDEVFTPHPDLLPFIHRAVGYSLTGEMREHCMFILHGGGANGKSTLLAVLQALLGEYAGTCAHSTLVARDHGEARNDLAQLRGKRLAVAQETKEGASLDEEVIKGLTSGDRVQVRSLYQEYFQMDPRFKIWLATNHLPKIEGADDGIWRRIRLIPFDVSFLGREDKGLLPTLLSELPGILNWALAGCMDWQREGLGTAQSIKDATAGYRVESDEVLLFATERCILDRRFSVRANALYASYKAWAGERGDKPMSNAMFGRRAAKLPGVRKRPSNGIIYEGIGHQVNSQEDRGD
jgi:putative DNA primase/helicase